MILSNVRIDWLFAFEPNKKGKYGCAILLPKGSDVEKQVNAEIEKARLAGISKNMYTEAQTKASSFKKCIHDGDAEYETGERGAHYKGFSYINANATSAPGIVGPDTKPLMDRKALFSGCYVNVDINFYPFNKESRGVGCGLNNIMLLREGERLDGRQSAEQAFAGFASAEDNLQ